MLNCITAQRWNHSTQATLKGRMRVQVLPPDPTLWPCVATLTSNFGKTKDSRKVFVNVGYHVKIWSNTRPLVQKATKSPSRAPPSPNDGIGSFDPDSKGQVSRHDVCVSSASQLSQLSQVSFSYLSSPSCWSQVSSPSWWSHACLVWHRAPTCPHLPTSSRRISLDSCSPAKWFWIWFLEPMFEIGVQWMPSSMGLTRISTNSGWFFCAGAGAPGLDFNCSSFGAPDGGIQRCWTRCYSLGNWDQWDGCLHLMILKILGRSWTKGQLEKHV